MKPGRKRQLRLGTALFAVLCLPFAVLLALSCLSGWFDPSKAWLMAVLGIFFIPLVIINFLLLLTGLAARSRAALIPLLALLPTLFFLGDYYRGKPDGQTGGQEGVRLVSYNVGRFVQASPKDKSSSRSQVRDSIKAFLLEQKADIICLQEYYVLKNEGVKVTLQKAFPGYDVNYYLYPTSRGWCGNVILSRYPRRGKGKIGFEDSSNLALWGEYDINGSRIRIYNCHFESYGISLQGVARSFLGDYRHTVSATGDKLRASILKRPAQVKAVLADVEKSPCRSVIAGDFNDNPVSYTYRMLSNGHKDTFEDAGRGFGATFRYMWPLLRIDYILSPQGVTASFHEVLRKRFSDHYPVVAGLQIDG